MAGETQVVEKTETVKVVEGQSNETDPAVAPEIAEVAAASGAVAVANDAVALNEKVAAEANLTAADIVRRSVGDFQKAFGELATWQGQTAERLQQTEVATVQLAEETSSIRSTLTELLNKLSQTPATTEAVEQIPPAVDPELNAEKGEPARPPRRHRFL